ncbi:porin Omp33-36 [Acinetobacter larvae]|uniref:Putative porin n=1 Tax=Acinetobacter larvae TaxID=1789224 RepID=A0A1B2M2S5_9GAMM|nr:porin Omp33-36 [Acinetobacter larvae]AOA59495.1 putative porin [Acinetobacter larvae]
MKKLGLATALLLAVTGAQAYQFEVQGQAEYIDTPQNAENFAGAVQGTYYFKDVDSTKGPLAEAAFLNQASNVSLGYSFAQHDVKHAGQKFRTESQSYGVKAEGYLPTEYVPVYGSASYSHTYTEGKKALSGEDNGDRYALEVGAVLTPNFLVAVGYTNVTNQFSMDTFGVLNNGIAPAALESLAGIQNKSDAVTARAKYVGPITGTNMAVGFETAATFGENNIYGVKGDLYLNPKLSVGATFLGSDMNSNHKNGTFPEGGRFDQAWGANVNYFINPAVAVGVSYLHANTIKAAYDTDTVGVNAKFRF